MDLSSLKLGVDLCAGQFGHFGHQRVALLLAQLARGHDLRRANARLLLQNAAPGRGHFGHVADAIVGDEHGEQVAQLLLQAQLGVQLVENRDLLRSRNGGIHEERAQLGAAIPCGEKIGELAVDGGRVELGGR